jgi:hypothetical protein
LKINCLRDIVILDPEMVEQGHATGSLGQPESALIRVEPWMGSIETDIERIL